MRPLTTDTRLLALLPALLLLLACGGAGRHRDMLAQLEELERQNVADSLMTDDTLAQALADFFDRHGTPNEQMRAHYILGRTYADLGEAPAAISAYLDAADRADTTAQDCDWAKLSRVYGQMSESFYLQNLMQENLLCLDKAAYCATMANDTQYNLSCQAHKIAAYIYLKHNDLVISSFDSVYKKMRHILGDKMAAQYCTLPVQTLLECGQEEKARSYMDIYRNESGFFDSLGNIEPGREVYYYLQGRFFLSQHAYDSAEHYFRKELLYGRDADNQSMASHGLAIAYEGMQKADSAVKYALYGYDMNDTAYAHLATEAVERVKSLYDYGRHQEIARQEHIRAARKEGENRLLYALLLSFVLLSFLAVAVWRKRRNAATASLLQKMEELERLYSELRHFKKREEETRLHVLELENRLAYHKEVMEEWRLRETDLRNLIGEQECQIGNKNHEVDILKNHELDLKRIIKEKDREISQRSTEVVALHRQLCELEAKVDDKERVISQLHDEITDRHLRQEQHRMKVERELQESELYRKFVARANGDSFNKRDFEKLEEMARNLTPAFYRFLASKRHSLTDKQFRLCLLLRYHLDINQSANLLGVSPSYVSRLGKEILNKLFAEDGNGLLLRKRLEAID